MAELIPCLSTPQTYCLTSENILYTGVTTLSVHLDWLLIKPGMDILQSLSSIKNYLGWSGKLILNAAMLVEKKGIVRIRSPHDGCIHRLSVDDVVQLLASFDVDCLLLPSFLQAEHVTTIKSDYLMANHASNASGGYYIEETLQSNDLKPVPNDIEYLMTDTLSTILDCNSPFIETSLPALLSMEGQVITDAGTIDLTDRRYEYDMTPIDDACACSTCVTKMTKAYLHHLYQQTPLLCYRYLMMHNCYFLQKLLKQKSLSV